MTTIQIDADSRDDAAIVAELLDAVQRLRPLIEANGPLAEAERQLPDVVFDAMADAGLFRMLAPRAYGGLELNPVDAMRVWEAVARADSAAAWNLVMNQAVGSLAAWLVAEGAQELFGAGPTTVAGAFFPPGIAERVDGGWRVTAQVPFASGCHNAQWFVLPALEVENGEPTIDAASGQAPMYAFFVPCDEAEILDTWHTVGMRGTGSADVAVQNAYVPDRRALLVGPLTDAAPGFEGPLYRMFPWPAILGEATVSVGVAAAAVDALLDLATTKTPAYNAIALREQPLAQHAAGRATARVNAARDTIHQATREAYDEVASSGSLLSWDAKVRLQLAVAHAAETCAEAVRLVTEAAGSSAIRQEHRFERFFRDCHVLTQHTSKSSPRYATAGKLLFGLENDWPWLSF